MHEQKLKCMRKDEGYNKSRMDGIMNNFLVG